MADIWNTTKRSEVMSRILSKDTRPERAVRHILSRLGYRYRLNVRTLPGKPDIVIRRLNAVVFVHGCFWHLHSKCRDGRLPSSRKSYWHSKLQNNSSRDIRNIQKLRRRGWKVLRLWECEIERQPTSAARKLQKLLAVK